MVIRCADPVSVFFDTYRNILYQSDISGQDAQSASIPRMFFPVGWKRQPEEGGIGPGCCGGGVITTRAPLPERCLLPLASLDHIHLSKPQNIHDCLHSRSDAFFLWRPSTTSTSQNLKNIHDCLHSRSDASFLWRPSTTST